MSGSCRPNTICLRGATSPRAGHRTCLPKGSQVFSTCGSRPSPDILWFQLKRKRHAGQKEELQPWPSARHYYVTTENRESTGRCWLHPLWEAQARCMLGKWWRKTTRSRAKEAEFVSFSNQEVGFMRHWAALIDMNGGRSKNVSLLILNSMGKCMFYNIIMYICKVTSK